mmetsp:Transcript_17835/g.42035  ORF Transcript_17835/g.42035 Transcript_17835/m.42035 type:complete len:252 (+) Transcript_17835:240-995(+)
MDRHWGSDSSRLETDKAGVAIVAQVRQGLALRHPRVPRHRVRQRLALGEDHGAAECGVGQTHSATGAVHAVHLAEEGERAGVVRGNHFAALQVILVADALQPRHTHSAEVTHAEVGVQRSCVVPRRRPSVVDLESNEELVWSQLNPQRRLEAVVPHGARCFRILQRQDGRQHPASLFCCLTGCPRARSEKAMGRQWAAATKLWEAEWHASSNGLCPVEDGGLRDVQNLRLTSGDKRRNACAMEVHARVCTR